MDAAMLTEAIKFAVHNKDQLKEITVRFSDETTVVGYLSKVSAGEVILTDLGAVPSVGRDHVITPERVVSFQCGLSDGSFTNFPPAT
jgi:hypothetical protein